MIRTRTVICAAVAILLCAAPRLLGQSAPADNPLRIKLVYADAALAVETLEIVRALGAVTFDVVAPDAKDVSLDESGRVQGITGGQPVFTMIVVEQSKGGITIEWSIGRDRPGVLDPSDAAKVAQRIEQLVAQRGNVSVEQVRIQVKALRRERESLREKQALLASLVRGHAKARKEGLNARLAQFDAERERLEIDLTASEARTLALRKQMDLLRARAEEKARNDPIQEQLQRVLKARQAEMTRLKQLIEAGGGSVNEIPAVEGRIADVEVQILMRREQVMRGDETGELLGRMASELAMIEIDRAEKEARLKYVLERLPQLNPRELDEKALEAIAEKYPTLVGEHAELPPLYYELDKRHSELLKKELALLVSEVQVVGESTTAPGR